MLEHELMPDGHHGRAMAPRQRVERGDRLEEIDDDIRLRVADDFIELADEARVFGEIGEDAEERGGVADRAVVLIFELQRRQLRDGHLHRRSEVFRHRPVRADAERYGDDLMARRLRHFLHRHRLRHVTATLAENAEHHFHGSERVLFCRQNLQSTRCSFPPSRRSSGIPRRQSSSFRPGGCGRRSRHRA